VEDEPSLSALTYLLDAVCALAAEQLNLISRATPIIMCRCWCNAAVCNFMRPNCIISLLAAQIESHGRC
jgi:hypothetical protein